MVDFSRGVLAVFAGCLVATAAMSVCETMGHAAFPPPVGIDPSQPGAVAAYVKGMRAVEFIPVLLGWAAGSLIGSSVAAKLASGWKLGCGLVVGALLLIAGIGNMVMIPHPAWVWVLALVIFPTTAGVGAMLGSAGTFAGPAMGEASR